MKGIIQGKTAIFTSENPFTVLSSAVMNGGLVKARAIVNHQVSKNFGKGRPEFYLERVVSKFRLPEPVVGLMTAVDITNIAQSVRRSERLTVSTFTTAGLSYPASAGDEVYPTPQTTGTVNSIILVDANMTAGCLVDAVKTATEAKTLALNELDVRSRFSKKPATGTTSDALAVACTTNGRNVPYAGTATSLGRMIATTVRESIEKSVQREQNLTRQRPLLDRLHERGIELEDLVATGMKLYTLNNQSRDLVSTRLRLGLRKALEDKNVCSLVLGALRLEEEGESGLISGLPVERFLGDPTSLVTDEIIGAAIANYIAGTWGVYNFQRYDRFKPGIMKKLGPFLDDMVAGLVAGVLSREATGE